MPTLSCKQLLACALLVLLMQGCSHGYHPLALSKKTKSVSELIDDAKECKVFKDELASPQINDDKVDLIFDQALRAHCVKKDV
jgi:hypothetical protein